MRKIIKNLLLVNHNVQVKVGEVMLDVAGRVLQQCDFEPKAQALGNILRDPDVQEAAVLTMRNTRWWSNGYMPNQETRKWNEHLITLLLDVVDAKAPLYVNTKEVK